MDAIYRLGDDRVLRIAEWEEALPWLEHGFGTKGSDDWPSGDESASLKQVHSTRVVVANQPGGLGEGDALATNQPGLFVMVKTADCIPVLFADPATKSVAAVHAGWRGTAGNIVRSTIETLVSEFHTEPSQLWAAIGPGIRKCCYEVSGDVARQFAAWLPELAGVGEKAMLDLTEVNRRQLIEAGLTPGHIFAPSGSECCTRCETELLHSFRRDGSRAGRMHSAVRVRNSN
jgi:YfiH family protein